MNAATERMTEVLKAQDWHFEVDEASEMINTGCRGKNGQWRIKTGGLNDHTVAILSRFPIDCPESKLPACAELLTRINFMMALGCFEMDYSDGCIFFKTNMPFEGEPPKPEVLDNLLALNLSMMDRYLPVIMQVIYADIAPAKAMANLAKADEKTKKTKAKSGKSKLTGPSRFQMN
ncbi:MAG: YbjN domain-containing protein [Verrucomicrobiota bacterium]